MELIIDIPKERDLVDKAIWYDVQDFDAEDLAIILKAIASGTPFDSVIKDIKNEIADEMILPMADVGLRVALEIIDKHISGKENE